MKGLCVRSRARWRARLGPTSSSSVSSRTESSGRFEREVKPNTDYAVYLEKGTRPGYWPKRGPIAAWLKARGVGDPKAATARVARHIFKHGTKAHPFWEPAFEEAEPKMRQIIDRYVQRGIEKVFA